MKTWAISDTHGIHRQAVVPENIDCVIHAGDSTNYYDLHKNQIEFEDFYDWLVNIVKARYKVICAGNHDTWATKQYNKNKLKDAGIIYLEHEYTTVAGVKIFGSPYTPTFGQWHFMKDRGKLDKYWRNLDEDIDILVTHGPPFGILDLTENRNYQLEQVGDLSLWKRVLEKRPKYHIFGHLHDFKTCRNFGSLKSEFTTIFMNVSSVEDGRFDKGLIHNGIIFDI